MWTFIEQPSFVCVTRYALAAGSTLANPLAPRTLTAQELLEGLVYRACSAGRSRRAVG